MDPPGPRKLPPRPPPKNPSQLSPKPPPRIPSTRSFPSQPPPQQNPKRGTPFPPPSSLRRPFGDGMDQSRSVGSDIVGRRTTHITPSPRAESMSVELEASRVATSLDDINRNAGVNRPLSALTAMPSFTIGVKPRGFRPTSSITSPPRNQSFHLTEHQHSSPAVFTTKMDMIRSQLIREIDAGLIRDFVKVYANGKDTVDANGIAEELSKKLKIHLLDFHLSQNTSQTQTENTPQTQPEKPPDPPPLVEKVEKNVTTSLTTSRDISPVPGQPEDEFSLDVDRVQSAIEKGDALTLNRILKQSTIEELMELCIDPAMNYNPLHYACMQGQYQIVHLLLKKKADPSILATGENIYAIHLFLRDGLTKAMEAIDKAVSEEEETEPRHSFIVPVVQRLLAGVSVNSQTSSGDTLLHYTCQCASVEVAQLLFDRDADPNIPNNSGLLPIHVLLDTPRGEERQKHHILQMMTEKMDFSLIRGDLKRYLQVICQTRKRDLYNVLSQWEYELETIVFFEKDFLDFPSELAGISDKHPSLIKAATYDELIARIIFTNHENDESYLAFALKSYALGGLDEILSRIENDYRSSYSKSPEALVSIVKFLTVLLNQRHLRVSELKGFDGILRAMQSASPIGMEKTNQLRSIVAEDYVHKETGEILEALKNFQPCTTEVGRYALTDLCASDAAKHLTMWNMLLHKLIGPMDLIRYAEFSNKIESKDDLSLSEDIAESIQRVQTAIKFFNDVSFWSASIILLAEGDSARKERVEYVIKVMDLCFVCKNYNSSLAILLGLKLRAVTTLGLIEQQSAQVLGRYRAVCDLFSYQGSHKAYRDTLLTLHAPAVPYLGILLRDLTYANDGSSDFLGSMKLFNLYKQRRMCKFIETYHSAYFTKAYNFNIAPETAKCLGRIRELSKIVNEDLLLQISNQSRSTIKKPGGRGDVTKLRQNLKDLFNGKKVILSGSGIEISAPEPVLSRNATSPLKRPPSAAPGNPPPTPPGGKLKPGGQSGSFDLTTYKESLTKTSEAQIYRIAVTSSDGFSLGYVHAEQDPDSDRCRIRVMPGAPKMQSKEIQFELQKHPDIPGKAVTLLSLFTGLYITSTAPEAISAMEADSSVPNALGVLPSRPWNMIDTTSTRWRICSDASYKDPQSFFVDSTDYLQNGPTEEPLQFTLQPINRDFPAGLEGLLKAGPPPAARGKKGIKRILGT